MKVTKTFNSILEKDIAKHIVVIDVQIFHKNGKPMKFYSFSQSFSIDEIYKEMNERHPNKYKEITISIKE